MRFTLTHTPQLTSQDCLIFGCFDNHPLPTFMQHIDQQHGGVITRLMSKLVDRGQQIWQADINGHSLVLIHCGTEKTYTPHTLKQALIDLTHTLNKQNITSVLMCMPQLAACKPTTQLQHMLLDIDAASYQCLTFKSKHNTPHTLQDVTFYLEGASSSALETAEHIAQAVHLTRDVANQPPNTCTPSYLAQKAHEVAKEYPAIRVNVLGREQIEKLQMGAFLAVAQGSHEEPKLIELHYEGAQGAPVVLIGKGVTFDSGGISLKSAAKMSEMKYDMAGAASVLGTLQACAAMKLPLHVIGFMACTENMPGGGAVKPGDIVTSMSGQTIEIINTDAEGRLILADTLTYAQRFKPRLMLDIATLTGAIIVALGHISSGLMTKDHDVAEWIMQAAEESQDKVWRLPLDDAYQESIDGNLSDIVNSTESSSAGSILAGCFLSRFTDAYPWAHLDVAGTAWMTGKKNTATGRPVPLLIQLLQNMVDLHAS